MSLTVYTTEDERLVSSTFCQLVHEGLTQGGLVVLVPTFEQVLRVQKALADKGLSLGVQVSTPQAWMRDTWDVWGDGRQIISSTQRLLLMTDVLAKDHTEGEQPQEVLAGTAQLLCDLAQRGYAWLPDALEKDTALTPAERRMAGLVVRYGHELAQTGLVEPTTCACELPERLRGAGVACAPMILAGFDSMSHADRAFIAGMSRIAQVSVVQQVGNELASACAQEAVRLLVGEARQQAVVVEQVASSEPVREMERSAELREILGRLYAVSGPHVRSTGAMVLLEPSGPLAEAELIAQKVAELLDDGASDIVVVVPDTASAWRNMAPKLVARNMDVRTQLAVPVLRTEAGRAFMGYVRTVAQLLELARHWPEPQEGVDGTYLRIGSMDWWPPKALVDFLLNDIAHVKPSKAYALDAAWRGDRLLSPQSVLDSLLSTKATSETVVRATRELMRGRLGSAASKLLAPYAARGASDPVAGTAAEVSLEDETNVAALAAIVGVAGTLKELGITADPSVDASVDLLTLVGKAELALTGMRVTLRPQAHAQQCRGTVVLANRPTASAMPAASVDVVVICGLTSQDFGVPSTDDELTGMLQDLRLEEPRDAMMAQRALFWRLCALPRTHLLLERPKFDSSSKVTYPAVMLNEVLACYETPPRGKPLAETNARANLSGQGAAPDPIATEKPAPAGRISRELSRLVTVPQEGKEELEGLLPVLSASQLESYLECPLKWFSLRRLRLGDNDAGFGPMEMGTFVHRVLELTYAQLFEEGRAVLDPNDDKAMAHAREVLNTQFSLHLEHQRMRAGSRPVYQALVPHSAWEESALDRLRRDLLSALEYGAARFRGYEPRAFEWEFGRGGRTAQQEGLPALEVATYAGVEVTGTVDRIDINGQGQAVIIDYKHKGPTGFFAEYAAFPKDWSFGDGFVLPRRIQALLYAQVVRRAFPDLRVVGALYFGTRGNHELSGAVDEAQADAIFGGLLSSRRAKRVTVLRGISFAEKDEGGMNSFLDATEEAIACKVQRLREGYIEAEPIDAAACSFCPVTNCERRITK